MRAPLTEPERRTLVALADTQPTTFGILARQAGYSSRDGVVAVVDRLRRLGLIADERHRFSPSRNPSRSLRLADGIVVSESIRG